MGIVYLYEHPGENGGYWYAAVYPLGATRYYDTKEARKKAVDNYVAAIEYSGGTVSVMEKGGEK